MKASVTLVAEIGSDRIPVLTNAEGDPSVPLTPGDYFLLSRMDGRTPIRALRSMVGLAEDAFALALAKVIASGMVRVPGVARRVALDAITEDLGLDPGDSRLPLERAATSASGSGKHAMPPMDPHAWSDRPPTPLSERSDWRSEDSKVRRSESGVSASSSAQARVSGRYSSGSLEAEPSGAFEAEKPAASSGSRPPALSRELVPANWPIRFEEFMFDPALMSSGSVLDPVQKQVVMYYHYHLRRVTYYDLFNLPVGASRREVKLAYFRLSKAFHPDRWYRKDTGEFGVMIEDVFKWLNRAYGVLSAPKKRRGYDKLISRGYVGEWELELERGGAVPRRAEMSAPSGERSSVAQGGSGFSGADPEVRRTATLLIAKAGQAESSGDWERACDLYTRALQVSPSAHLRIRLVECMLQAKMATQEIERQIEAARVAGAEERTLLLAEARLALNEGNPSRAVHRFAQVLDIDPMDAEALAGLKALRNDQAPAG